MSFVKKKKDNQKEINSAYSKAGPYLNITYFFISAMIIFGFVGYKIDQAYGFNFLFLLIGLFVGLSLGFYKLYIVITHIEKDPD
ncbi:MAG: AtpZ/AtpI family protein [Calditrichaeota bacterium]|nr:AtpZ/AtpI family protein [Calditrichota bacterium]